MTDPSTWTVTTHDWTMRIDEDHLARIRNEARVFGAGGVRHLILEILAYADDEAHSLGRPGTAVVRYHGDGSVSVTDDGRGTDTRRDAAGRIVRKPVMATRDVRFFDAPDPPRLPDGLPRRGMSVVAALSAVVTHENRRGLEGWSQAYRHGRPDADLTPLGDAHSSGTTVTFRVDDRLDGPDRLMPDDLTAFESLRVTTVEVASHPPAAGAVSAGLR